MKDPLQTVSTPFEVLGAEPDASTAEIRKAFMHTLAARRVPANTVKMAFDALSRPLERARRRILQFPPEILQRLIPNPMKDRSVLSPSRRAETAAAWERHLKKTFPDLQTTHCLAVLWYWWTLYEEQRIQALIEAGGNTGALAEGGLFKPDLLRRARKAEGVICDPLRNQHCEHKECPRSEDCHSSAPPIEKMWHKLIGYWGTLAAAREFWNGWEGVSESDAGKLTNEFVNSLHNEFLASSRYYSRLLQPGNEAGAEDELTKLPDVGAHEAAALRSAGLSSLGTVVRGGMRRLADVLGISLDKAREILVSARTALSSNSALSGQYRALPLVFATEMETAEAMAKVGVGTRQGAVRCGAVMLHNLGLLDTVRSKVRDAMQISPENQGLQRLYNALSRHFSVSVLIANERPEEALQTIERLPAEDRNCEEVLQMKSHAFDLLARQQVGMGQIEDALASWTEALTCNCDVDARKKIRAKIVSTCKSRASVMQDLDLARAISLLELGLQLVEHQDLHLAMGELLNQRAIRMFRSLQEGSNGLRRVILQQDLPVLRNILADLKRAVEIGIASAGKHAKVVQELIDDLDFGKFSLPG